MGDAQSNAGRLSGAGSGRRREAKKAKSKKPCQKGKKAKSPKGKKPKNAGENFQNRQAGWRKVEKKGGGGGKEETPPLLEGVRACRL